ncbi:MAG: beta-ketoacyl-ACP synthase II [Planctomycetota bacterium]
MQRRRVVITGAGIVSPVGNDKQTAWKAICEGRSGIDHIEAFDTSEFKVRIAGEVPEGFGLEELVDKRQARRMDRFVQFAVVAAESALERSGLLASDYDPAEVGSYIGTGIGGISEIEDQHTRLMERGPRRMSPLMIPKMMSNAAAGQVSIRHEFTGPSMSVSSACASGSNAIGEAMKSIRNGMVDVQVCGGSEAAVTPMGLGGFMQLKALSKRNDEPERASRPFDRDRDGFVMAEGAAIFVMEALEHARKRNAPIIGEIVGYGASSDAYHMTLPCEDGNGAQQAMRNALSDAQMDPQDIQYINAHGTGTPAGDDIEAQAIARVFDDHAEELAVSSSKSIFGHLLGASGALESAVCLWAMQDGICPPTINLDNIDTSCGELNFVPHSSQERELKAVMNNSFGFGGHNVSLIFRRFEE